jgi:sugar O-acyltransferase (sialic acid O-acetyltransferase NeuD family)
MKEYVIFGICGLLSDIFDLIHDNGGKVRKIYLNMPEVKDERVRSLEERVAMLGYPVEIHHSLDPFVPDKEYKYVIGTTTPRKHRLIAELKRTHNLTFSPLIHSTVHLGSHVHIGEGVLINARSTIGPNVYLDDHCVISRCVNIGHDTRIGKFSNIAPAVSIAGSSEIGEGCRVGIGATIIDRLRIGDKTIIGAGSVVTRDLPESVVAYGVPAAVKRRNDE